jgi:pyridoxal phosphate enzyme (YggS family)
MEVDIAAGIERVEERIESSCLRCGRKREDIRLMAVSKFHGPEKAALALRKGIRLFGESRVKEGMEKFGLLREKAQTFGLSSSPNSRLAEIHLIGSLQRNKARAASDFFDCIESVDRLSLIDELGSLTRNREKPLMILLEYHTGEESKAGFSGLDSLFEGAETALSFPGLLAAGLMTMAPFTKDEHSIRVSFRALVRARDELEKRFPGHWPCLSMGMSGDFEIAIEEGSTLVRIGTAIFGERTG